MNDKKIKDKFGIKKNMFLSTHGLRNESGNFEVLNKMTKILYA